MRRETMMNKLADILGLEELKVPVDKKGRKVEKKLDAPVGISEAELDSYREAQAISYFFKAPELFTSKTCPHCGEVFLVSRQFVAFCSYTCIYKDLQEKGIEWSRKTKDGFDIDKTYIDRILEGNEPLWIRKTGIETIRKVLDAVPAESLLVK